MPKQDDFACSSEAVPQIAVPVSVLVERTEQLLASLHEAFEKPSETGNDQDRYMLALQRVAEFLDAIGVKESYGRRFADLAIAIGDLEHGTVHPLLKPRSFGKGRASDPSQTWIQRACVALAVGALITSGLKRTEAAREIVRRFPAVATLARTGEPGKSRAAVLSWYENFRRGEVKNRAAVTVYGMLQEQIRDKIGSDSEGLGRTVEFLLQQALSGEL
jgi:hypothetical protein